MSTFPTAALRELVDRLVEGGYASAALFRLDEGPRTWSASAGAARHDETNAAPVDTAGHFRIGSITKTFAATVTMQLVDEGVVELDAPVDQYLPGLVPAGDRVTVRHVLHHTSGLYDYMDEPGWTTNTWRGEARFDRYTPTRLLGVAFSRPAHFEPGRAWRYSNTNYIIVGLLIERLTGDSYGNQVRRRILSPLRMHGTTVPGNDPSIPEPYARAYRLIGGEFVDVSEQDPSLDWAAGEMISTAGDLNRFMLALTRGELTSAKALDTMRRVIATDRPSWYGLGLMEPQLPCGRPATGHGGGLLGYVAYALADPLTGRAMTLSYCSTDEPITMDLLLEFFVTAFCE